MTLRLHPDEIIAQSKSPLLAVHDTWERVRIRDICEVKNGGAFRSSHFNAEGHGIPLIRIRDVGQKESKTYYSGEYKNDYIVVSDDLVIGMDGDFRCAVWKGQPALLNQRVCRLRVRNDEHYSTQFLSIVLQGYLDAVHAATSAVTVKHLSSRTVLDLPIPLPPLAEQERIVGLVAEILTRLDATELTLRSLLDKAKLLGSAILADAFHTNRDLPSGWEQTTVGAVCLPVYKTDPRKFPDVDFEYIDISSVGMGTGNISRSRTLLGMNAPSRARQVVKAGDTVLSTVRTYQKKTALVPAALNEAVASTGFSVLRPSDGVHPYFLFFQVFGDDFVRSLNKKQTGTSYPAVRDRDVKSMPFRLAPFSEQEAITAEIEERFSRIDATKCLVENLVNRVVFLRRSVLTEAFAGRLVPQDSDDEPASALLERIATSRPARPKRRRKARS